MANRITDRRTLELNAEAALVKESLRAHDYIVGDAARALGWERYKLSKKLTSRRLKDWWAKAKKAKQTRVRKARKKRAYDAMRRRQHQEDSKWF